MTIFGLLFLGVTLVLIGFGVTLGLVAVVIGSGLLALVLALRRCATREPERDSVLPHSVRRLDRHAGGSDLCVVRAILV